LLDSLVEELEIGLEIRAEISDSGKPTTLKASK